MSTEREQPQKLKKDILMGVLSIAFAAFLTLGFNAVLHAQEEPEPLPVTIDEFQDLVRSFCVETMLIERSNTSEALREEMKRLDLDVFCGCFAASFKPPTPDIFRKAHAAIVDVSRNAEDFAMQSLLGFLMRNSIGFEGMAACGRIAARTLSQSAKNTTEN